MKKDPPRAAGEGSFWEGKKKQESKIARRKEKLAKGIFSVSALKLPFAKEVAEIRLLIAI